MAEESSQLAEQLGSRNTGLVALEAGLMILINIGALLGNLMVCLAVYRCKSLQTIPNMYVVALAISDALMATLAIPFSCAFLITGRWLFGKSTCQFQGFFSFFLALLSVMTMTATAVNRFFHIVKPNFYRKYITFKVTLLSLTVITFVTAMGGGLASMAGWATFKEHHGKVFCFMEFKSATIEKLYIGFLDIFYIFTPMAVIYICYFRIFRLVRAHRQDAFVSSSGENTSRKARRFNVEEVKVTKVLFVIVLGFTICWTPIALLDMIDIFSTHSVPIPRQAFLLYIYLGYGSTSINPFIYGIMNRAFRVEFLKIVRLCGKRDQVSPTDKPNTVAQNTVATLRISVMSKQDIEGEKDLGGQT